MPSAHSPVSHPTRCTTRLQHQHKLLLRFVIGYSQDPDEMLALDAEASNHGGFVRLAVEVSDNNHMSLSILWS